MRISPGWAHSCSAETNFAPAWSTRIGPRTKIIPGHGPITDRNGVIAERDLILTLRDRIAALAAQGKTLEEAEDQADSGGRIPT